MPLFATLTGDCGFVLAGVPRGADEYARRWQRGQFVVGDARCV